MKVPFPERGLAHRHATLRAQAGSCTEPPSATPRGLSNERRSPTCVHLILKPSTCAVRRGVPAVRLQRDERSAPRGVVDEEQLIVSAVAPPSTFHLGQRPGFQRRGAVAYLRRCRLCRWGRGRTRRTAPAPQARPAHRPKPLGGKSRIHHEIGARSVSLPDFLRR